MQKANIKNNDDLVLGIQTILSKYRCSFSDEEKVLLNDCIIELEKSNAESSQTEKALTALKVVSTVMRVFSIYDHLKDLF
ncbi:MAG: hypothetical protein V4594_21035 [Bacteroidota bacterium]